MDFRDPSLRTPDSSKTLRSDNHVSHVVMIQDGTTQLLFLFQNFDLNQLYYMHVLILTIKIRNILCVQIYINLLTVRVLRK